jgi:hypothetical protein
MARHIEVEAMSGMNRKQVKLTNGIANILVNKHHMCLDCAIQFSVAWVWGQDRTERNPTSATFCSQACGGAVQDFFEETLGIKGEPVSPDELPWMAN